MTQTFEKKPGRQTDSAENTKTVIDYSFRVIFIKNAMLDLAYSFLSRVVGILMRDIDVGSLSVHLSVTFQY